MTVDQRFVDRIVARAQNSMTGLGDPEKGERSYDLSKHANPDLESVAILIVSAHHAKYDLISLMLAAMQEVAESMKEKP